MVVTIVSIACLSYTAVQATYRMRMEYFKSTLRQDFAYTDVAGLDGAASRLSGDVMLVQQGMNVKLAIALQQGGTLVVGFVLGYLFIWQLALVVTAFVPLLGVAGGATQVLTQRFTKAAQTAYARAGDIASEVINQIRTVHAYHGEEAEKKRYSAHLGEASKATLKRDISQGVSAGVLLCVMMTAYGVGLYYGVTLIAASREDDPTCLYEIDRDGCITGGNVMQTFFALIMASFAIGQVLPSLGDIATARASAHAIFEMIDRPVSIDAMSDAGAKPSGFQGTVEFKNVTFAYPSRADVPILRNFNLTIPAGSTVALVGHSGSGKSTVVSLLQRWYDVQGGEVLLDGRDVKSLNVQWLRSQQALVAQAPLLFNCSIAQNIALGHPTQSATQEEIIAAAKAANAHDFITQLPEGYDTSAGQGGAALSGGQRQRIAIARALVRHAGILLLDEATSALDSTSERIVQASIDSMLHARAGQQTAIVIAHRLSTVRNADVIVVMAEGNVVEQGSHAELMAKEDGVYRSMVNMQALGTEGSGTTAAAAEPSSQATKPVQAAPSAGAGESGGDVAVSMADQELVVVENVGAESKSDSDIPVADEELEKKRREALPPVPFKRIWSYQGKDTRFVWPAMLGSTASGVFMVLFSILLSKLIAICYLPDSDEMRSEAAKYAVYFVLMGLGLLCGHLLSGWGIGMAGSRFTRRLREDVFAALMRQDISWFDSPENTTGRVAARLSRDAALVQAATGLRLSTTVQSVGGLLAGLIIAFTASWKLTLIVLACFPLMAAAGFVHMKLFMGGTDAKASQESGHVVNEALDALRIVHAFGLQHRMLNDFQAALLPSVKKEARSSMFGGVAQGATNLIMFGSYALAFYAGSKFVASGEMSFEDVNLVLFAIIFAGQGAGNASALAGDVKEADGAARSIFSMLDRQPSITLAATKGGAEPAVNQIEFKDVHFSYPTRPDLSVLKGVSFTIGRGQSVALVGPSGSGKSTIVALLQRWYDAASGSVLVGGEDIKSSDLEYVRSKMALVSQQPRLFSDSVAYNVQYGVASSEKAPPDSGVPLGAPADASHEGIWPVPAAVEEALEKANAAPFVNALPHGSSTHVGQGTEQLSGGQIQRVALARCFMRDAELLLFDESTAALDVQAEREVQAAIDEMVASKAEQGTSIVIIAHRLSTIRDVNKIVVIDQGKVVQQGTYNELLGEENGLFRSLVLAQEHGEAAAAAQE